MISTDPPVSSSSSQGLASCGGWMASRSGRTGRPTVGVDLRRMWDASWVVEVMVSSGWGGGGQQGRDGTRHCGNKR